MLLMPDFLYQINYSDKILDYNWTDKMSDSVLERDIEGDKLLDILSQLNYKAVFGFGIAAGEWIFWRFNTWRPEVSNKNMNLALQATEAHWYGLINKYYIYMWRNGTLYDDLPKGKDQIERPLWLAHRLQNRMRHDYVKAYPSLYGDVTRLLNLARYISGDEKLFDDWLTDCLKRAVKIFPNQQWPADEDPTDENMNANYDSNQDPFIPREFYFMPDFDYETADLIKMQQELLKQADYKQNNLLNPSEDMIAEGFKGTPYQFTLDN